MLVKSPATHSTWLAIVIAHTPPCVLPLLAAGPSVCHIELAVDGSVTGALGPPVIASALPQTWGDRINKWLPSNAGQALMSFESDNTTLSPWRGFIVFCVYAAVAIGVAAVLLERRDA